MSSVMRYDRSCRCPRCRLRLTGLRCEVMRCPRCRSGLPPSEVWKDRKYPGLIELRASTAMALALAGGLTGAIAAGLIISGVGPANGDAIGLAWLFTAGVVLLCFALGVMRWTMHRGASRDQRVW